MSEIASLARFAALAGATAMLNLCALAVLAAYLAYALGGRTAAVPRKALAAGVLTTLGLIAAFAAAGAATPLAGASILRFAPWGLLATGVGGLALGGVMLLRGVGGRDPSPGGADRAWVGNEKGRSLAPFVLLGAAYGVASLERGLPAYLMAIGHAPGGGLGALAIVLSYGVGASAVLLPLALAAQTITRTARKAGSSVLPRVRAASGVVAVLGSVCLLNQVVGGRLLSASLAQF